MRWTALIFATVLSCVPGCTIQKPMYVWLNYSDSLYSLKKNPTPETLATHKEVLLKIMEESKEAELRVPPGVYAEYGYLLFQEGQVTEAVQYFDKEATTYPESREFIERLKLRIAKKVSER